MKFKGFSIAIAIIAVIFAFSNYSFSQSSETKNCETKKCETKKCETKSGSCSGKCSESKSSCSDKGNSKSCCSDKNKTGNSQGTQDSVKVCPVAGEKIEGQGVKLSYLGKEYTFCCEGCAAKFQKEPLDYIKEEILCPVMGEAASKESFTEYNGTKYYFCCAPCIKKFNKDPDKYKEGYKETK